MIIPLWAYGVGGAVLLAVGFGGGWSVRDWKADSDTLAAKVEADRARDKAVKAAYDASASFEGERAIIQVEAARAQSTVREIYRDVQVPADCAVRPDGLRLLDDAIASGSPTPREPVAALPANP
jgi:hypothetical protein